MYEGEFSFAINDLRAYTVYGKCEILPTLKKGKHYKKNGLTYEFLQIMIYSINFPP